MTVKTILQQTKTPQRQQWLCVGVEILYLHTIVNEILYKENYTMTNFHNQKRNKIV